MNKYLVEIPYDFTQYGSMSCFIYAESEDEAMEKADNRNNWCNEEYNDTDGGDTNYDYSGMSVALRESGVEPPIPPIPPNRNNNNIPTSSKAAGCPYFLNEINKI
jgi:hypothetical protein